MKYVIIAFLSIWLVGCSQQQPESRQRIPVILDTDANNELDDQHAIAYLLCSQDDFNILGFTVNATRNGGPVEEHYKEAERVLSLFNMQDQFVVKKGADGEFSDVEAYIDSADFDGAPAVDFIIEQAKKYSNHELVLIPIGKLTNIALALRKAPGIAENIRVVWLGSNYPGRGEYNLDNDTSALQYLLSVDVPFEIVTVNYGGGTGTMDVKVSIAEIDSVMPGKGPEAEQPVTGRHGGTFTNFGDYSVNLFHHIDQLFGEDQTRSLFDIGAVAVVKHPSWAVADTLACPEFSHGGWIQHPTNKRKVIFWHNFERDSIVNDLYHCLGD